MHPSAHLYAALLLISGTVAAITAVLAWRRRHSTGGKPLVLMMIAMVVWSWTYALHWISPANPAPFFWLDATYLGVLSIPALVLVFAFQVSSQGRRIFRALPFLLSIEPILTLLLLLTDNLHHLFYGNFRQTDATNIFNGGPWFWVNVVYSYTLFIISFYLLITALFRSRGQIFRNQIGICAAGLGLLFVVNLLGIFGVEPLPGLDLTPILFTITGLLFAISISAFHMLDLVPVAQDVLIDQMKDGMIVIDHLGRIVDINQAAAHLIEMPVSSLIGQNLIIINTKIPELANVFSPLPKTTSHVEIINRLSQVLDVQINPLHSSSTKIRGYLVSWRDISHLKQVENELRKANEILSQNLHQINSLRASLEEQVIRDALTGLFNRRFLETMVPDEFDRAERLNVPLSLLVIDIDHFKIVNDQYGHAVGDLVLKQLSKILEASIRKGDWAIRFGGEEFLAVMVDTTSSIACQRAEKLRKEVQEMEFLVENRAIHITVSIGIATFPEHGNSYEIIFREADQSLYRAKTSGRNCTFLASVRL